jgi:uncharacterized LabA/DUF88 family protein
VTTQPTQPENNDAQATVVEESSASNSPSTTDAAEVAASNHIQDAQNVQTPALLLPLTGEPAAQSFTAFIEEFRQKEERQGQPDAQPEDDVDRAPAAENNEQQTWQAQNASTQEASDQAEAPQSDEAQRASTPSTPTAPPERPVSPLLRPATRIRMPRQGSGRQREAFVTQRGAAPSSTPKTTSNTTPAATNSADAAHQVSEETPAVEVADETNHVPTAEEVKTEQSETPRPARRYRFDRPASTAITSKPAVEAINRSSTAPSPNEPAGARPRPENIQPEQAPKAANGPAIESQSSTGTKFVAPETVAAPASEATAAPASATRSHNDRRRRHGQEGQHVKTPTPVDALKADVLKADTTKTDAIKGTPVGEQPAPAAQAETEIPVEDLPPLEYAELQAASRRRRRRRTNGTNANAVTSTSLIRSTTQPPTASPSPIAPVSPVAPRNVETINRAPSATPNAPATPYTVQSGVTVSQMNQGNDAAGPFQGPEPTPARGSVLPPQPRLTRPMRNGNEAQRGSISPITAARAGSEGMISTGAINHLANVISQAMQIQSDRMVAELRRANQTPANVSVTLPPFPSTERVGVFVDVANLLYSARTLRMTIDFGKLLDFLRGNRRLVRAHAYCPTSPQPGDDQMFLQAVKGLGYRITTKNYKTFASGAKKADMDLDLCMDVVRLVDGGAVDCIVLVSGDGDFIPMLDYCSDHGVRVEVVAFDESMSASLRQSCDLFINLSMLDEIRVS